MSNSKHSNQRPEKSPLAKRREELGLTQSQLGQMINKSDQTISNWEQGIYAARLSSREFKALCAALQWHRIEDVPERLGPEV